MTIQFPTRSLQQCNFKLTLLFKEIQESPTGLEAAAKIMGFRSYANGAAKSVFYSMQLYGLIAIDNSTKTLSVTKLGKDIQTFTTGPSYEDDLYKAAFRPQLFSDLRAHFGDDVLVARERIRLACRDLALSEYNSRIAASSYYHTLIYLHNRCPSLSCRESVHKNTDEGRFSIFYPGEGTDHDWIKSQLRELIKQI